MSDEKSQIEHEVSQVPCAHHAMLLFENGFIHANAARAVAHSIRHNDHVIWQKEAGLVRLQEQLATGFIPTILEKLFIYLTLLYYV